MKAARRRSIHPLLVRPIGAVKLVLHDPGRDARLEAIARLLAHGAAIGRRCGYGGAKSATLLHFAAAWGQRRAAELLVARGADLDAIDDEYKATRAG